MLQLLPPICRDCGKAADEAKLSPYLDFHLCGPCIARREREVLRVDGSRPRKAPGKKSRREVDAPEAPAPKKPKPKVKKPNGRGRRS